MKRYTTAATAAGFFGVAAISCLSGCDPLTSGGRAVVAAAVMYVLARIVERVLLSMMADAMIRSAGKAGRKETAGGESVH